MQSANEPDLFRLPGPFQSRDVVTISADCEQPKVAGRTGVVDGGYSGIGESEGFALSIWVEELGESFLVETRFLAATGERRSPPASGRVVWSTRVSEDGEGIGEVSYVIVDEVEAYL